MDFSLRHSQLTMLIHLNERRKASQHVAEGKIIGELQKAEDKLGQLKSRLQNIMRERTILNEQLTKQKSLFISERQMCIQVQREKSAAVAIEESKKNISTCEKHIAKLNEELKSIQQRLKKTTIKIEKLYCFADMNSFS